MDDLHISSFEELALLVLMKTRLPDDPFGINKASAMRAVAEIEFVVARRIARDLEWAGKRETAHSILRNAGTRHAELSRMSREKQMAALDDRDGPRGPHRPPSSS